LDSGFARRHLRILTTKRRVEVRTMKDLLRISNMSAEGLSHTLSLSIEAKLVPHRWRDLEGEAVVLYFSKPSTRTRISFETAVTRLGGTPITVGPDELQLGRGETIEDTAKVISRFAKAFVIRTFDDEDVRRFAAAASIPVINALTDGHHPCQALADLMTLRERFGRLRGLKVAYIGDGNNVARSLIEACALAGVDIAVATPPGFEPSREVVAAAERASIEHDSLVWTTHDPLLAVAGANAVYTDVWMSMGIPEGERAAREVVFRPYEVTDAVMAEAAHDAVFMHCLPAHRSQEVAPDVIDGPQSVVFEQAENRLHTAIGVLHGLLERSIEGADDASLYRSIA
jgi:ornithine carbamoyltransferase